MAVRLSNTTHYYQRSTDLPAGNSDFTLTAWLYRVAGGWSCFFTRVGGSSPTWYLGFNDSGANGGAFLEISDATVISSGTSQPLAQWIHYALVRSGNTYTIYINGGSVGSGTNSGTSSTTFAIGRDFAYGDGFNGRIAAVKFWTAALSQSEIQAEMNYYVPLRTASLHAVHYFRTPGTDATTDQSGNGRNLTENGSPSTEDGPNIQFSPSLVILKQFPRALLVR